MGYMDAYTAEILLNDTSVVYMGSGPDADMMLDMATERAISLGYVNFTVKVRDDSGFVIRSQVHGNGGIEPGAAISTWEIQQSGSVRYTENIEGGGGQAVGPGIARGKAYAAAQGWESFTVIVRDPSGTIVGSEAVGGDTSLAGSDQGNQGEGGGDEQNQGEGQPADMGYRFRLVGWKWIWDTPKPHNPDEWTGSGSKMDIQTTGYTYGSARDALDAGKGIGDTNLLVLEVFAESNYPTQFAGLYYAYTGRDETAKNAAAKEKAAASVEFHAHHHWDPSKGEYVDDVDQYPPPPPPPPLAGPCLLPGL